MAEDTQTQQTAPQTQPQTESKSRIRRVVNRRGVAGGGAEGRGGEGGGRPRRGRAQKGPRRERSEFNQRVISIRRVTRVMAGGRRFSFSVALVLGDSKGRVGVGTGKANDTILAIEKATRQAKKGMITVSMDKKTGTIPHEVKAKYCASTVILQPNNGRGVVAGSSVRDVLELAGVKDVSGKLLSRSKNKLNNAQATVKALSGLAKIS